MHHTQMEQLRSLRLNGMATALSLQWEQPVTYADLSFEQRLGMLLDNLLFSAQLRK
uniref:IstB-like ATP binding N-terminal n=1 Tax=Candidatus Kentrum sp. MB TaxID=2138164 RepID=A0A451BHB0_9GAMM|nr:MAG: IstB-like ATP binding N-terminal [Candidatus Kentron sp. MB]